MPRIKANFRGRQQNLYTLSRKAWGYCLEHVSDIGKAKSIYTPSFIADNLNKVDEAEAIPDYYNRKDLPKEDYDKMQKAALVVTDNWQLLKEYTTDAFPKELLQSKLEAAGQAHYRFATGGNWDSVASLIVSANTFLKSNGAKLQAGENMPAEFPKGFEDAGKAFNELRTAYFGKEDDRDGLSTEKADADTEVHNSLMKMLRLAQRVFKDKPDIKKKFVYSNLLKEVRGNQPAGLKGMFTDADTKKPLAGVVIRAIDTDYVATSAKDGRYDVDMASGVYDLEVSAPGYQSVFIEQRKIEVGIKHRLNLALATAPIAEKLPTSNALSEMLKDVPLTNGVGV